MIILTEKGLHCRAGDFYIDPRRGVEHAVVTHAHSDHARRGSQNYYCAAPGVSVLRARLGKKINVHGIPYGHKFTINGVTLSFHSAGHILGSAQVRIQGRQSVWVCSGDYKRENDPTCAPFEVVPCDVFITEATFGTPAYSWKRDRDLGEEIFEWWETNSQRKMNSVLFAYSLGKAQRILGVLAPFAKRPIYCHSTVSVLNDCYRNEGVPLADTICLSQVEETSPSFQGELFLVPPSFLENPKAQLLGNHYETAFASGWMSKSFQAGYDRGFVMSDHADWEDLVRTIKETSAKKVYVQHRGKGSLVRYLNGIGIEAHSESELIPKNPDQLPLFEEMVL